jgi:FkbM family methyltransferase
MLCFDVGANQGDRARLLISLGARVVAVEPQPECVDQLRRIRGLTVEAVALGAKPGTAEIRLATASTIASMSAGWVANVMASGRFGEHEWRETLTVPVSTLDDLVARYGVPGFCKIDVEGYEPQVLAGLSQPLPIVSFEYTAEWVGGSEAIERLLQLAPYRFNFAPGSSHRLEWDEWRDADALLDHFASLEPRELGWGDAYARLPERGVEDSAPQT